MAIHTPFRWRHRLPVCHLLGLRSTIWEKCVGSSSRPSGVLMNVVGGHMAHESPRKRTAASTVPHRMIVSGPRARPAPPLSVKKPEGSCVYQKSEVAG